METKKSNDAREGLFCKLAYYTNINTIVVSKAFLNTPDATRRDSSLQECNVNVEMLARGYKITCIYDYNWRANSFFLIVAFLRSSEVIVNTVAKKTNFSVVFSMRRRTSVLMLVEQTTCT